MATTIAQLERNLKRAQTIHDQEQAKGQYDISVRQTRRMYLASMALMKAGGALQRARRDGGMWECTPCK